MFVQETMIREVFEEPIWYLAGTAYNIRIRAETVREFAGNAGGLSILDVGCGDGSISLPLLTGDNRLTLLDQSKKMTAMARMRVPGRLASRVTIINSDFMSASFEPGSFDVILCVGVLAYINFRQPFIERLVSLLRPGGSIIEECTDGGHFVSYLNRAYAAVRNRFPGSGFSTVLRPGAEVESAFRDFGFQAVETFRYSLPLPGLRKLLPQELKYRAIRHLYGYAGRSRMAWLGNECIYHFRRLENSGAGGVDRRR